MKAGDFFDLGDGVKTKAPGMSGVAAHDCRCRCFLEYNLMTAEEFAKATGKTTEEVLKTLRKQDDGGIIKNIDLDDLEVITYNTGMEDEVVEHIGSKVKELEKTSGVRFNYVSAEIKDTGAGGKPIFQTEPISYGRGKVLLQLNINTEILAGKSIKDIDEMFKNADNTVVNSLDEALVHEMGHAKLISGLTLNQIEDLYGYLLQPGKRRIFDSISDIAFADGAEAIAEIEVLIACDEKILAELKEFYMLFMGR